MAEPAHLKVDPRRGIVQAERHARPPVATIAPSVCQHLVFHSPNLDIATERRSCLNICEKLGLSPKGELTDQISADDGTTSLKWERHTEFSSYTFIKYVADGHSAFEPWSSQKLGWDEVPGRMLVSMLVGIESFEKPVWSNLGAFTWTADKPLCSSLVLTGSTVLESDLHINESGHTHYLLKTSSKESARLGRLLQRLVEVETYGALCLYAWKDVKEIGPLIGEAEEKLGELISRLAAKSDEPDETILNDLARLSAFHEETTSKSHFRLNASLAYHDIVERRLGELREERVSGCQRLASFVLRRMNPAARTYKSVLTRQAEMADRINRATQLLRGRIEVAIGKQNQELLKSMNDRAEAQYRLQKTVEGLSVVAISYYALGILSYVAALFAGKYLGLGTKEIVGMAVLPVLLLAWFGISRLKR